MYLNLSVFYFVNYRNKTKCEKNSNFFFPLKGDIDLGAQLLKGLFLHQHYWQKGWMGKVEPYSTVFFFLIYGNNQHTWYYILSGPSSCESCSSPGLNKEDREKGQGIRTLFFNAFCLEFLIFSNFQFLNLLWEPCGHFL